jgi:dTDP-4-dehydrorhamnose reductase
MRIAVTGQQGQVARALADAGPAQDVEVIRLGRPQLDLTAPETVARALQEAAASIVVNAAAYTGVDQAERESEIAFAVNGAGAAAVAEAARTLGVPVIHLSTDYVYDGKKSDAYIEDDCVAPAGVYGASKLAGERTVAAATGDHVILRTSWVYAPYGKNFVRTMLALAQSRDEVRVVADQCGCPTYAPDIAAAIIGIARNLLKSPVDPRLRGIFHMTGSGQTSWAGFAEAIFRFLAEKGLRTPVLTPITSADYPTPARRPANSRLDCSKIATVHGIKLPLWRDSLEVCLEQLITECSQPMGFGSRTTSTKGIPAKAAYRTIIKN